MGFWKAAGKLAWGATKLAAKASIVTGTLAVKGIAATANNLGKMGILDIPGGGGMTEPMKQGCEPRADPPKWRRRHAAGGPGL